jgi:SAM-dependent methyltransferase
MAEGCALSSTTDLFSDHSAHYAAVRPQYPRALIEWIASAAPSRGAVWDCGCGSGQAAIALAQHFDRVLATDLSAAQLAEAPAHPRVTYLCAAAEAVDLPEQSFDAVCVAQALHWFDMSRFSSIVERALRPGGLFVAFGYNFFSVSDAFDARFREQVLAPLESYWAPQNRLLWNAYRDLSLPFEEIAAPVISMSSRANLPELLAYVQSWSAVSRYRREHGDAAWARLLEGLGEVWPGAPDQSAHVEFDFVLRATRRPASQI